VWSEILEALLKTFGPMAGLFVLLLLVLAFFYRQNETAKNDRIEFLEKALSRSEGRADTLASEARDFAEKTGEARAREARTLAEIVTVMRDAVTDGREERRQYMVILENQRRDAADERKEILDRIDRGQENVVAAIGLLHDRRGRE
jgi:hypothetical protein